MSRIRGIEPKVKKEISHPVKKKIDPTTREKDDVKKKDEVAELLAKLPNLAKTLDIHRKIGEGTFSSVYLGSSKQQVGLPDSEKKWYAVKHLVPTTHPTRVAHELRCLKDIGGKHHVIGVEKCLRNLDCVVFIMPYVPHKKFSEYMGEMDADELREYMRALLTALRHVHSFGVIHRDVKPSNFLYDRKNRRYALVDFGLAQHTYPASWMDKPPPAHQSLKRTREDDTLPEAKRMALDLSTRSHPSNASTKPTPVQPIASVKEGILSPPPAHWRPPARPACACQGLAGVCGDCTTWAPPRANRAGTQGFRPPEVLFKYPAQSTAVDMWACGVILASVLSGRYPFFRAADDMSALGEMMTLLGTSALHATAHALGCRLVTSVPRRGFCLRKLSAYLRSGWRPRPRGGAPSCDGCRQHPAACVCRDNTLPPGYKIDPTATYCGFPDSAFALADRLLEPNPRARLTAAEALQHPFLR